MCCARARFSRVSRDSSFVYLALSYICSTAWVSLDRANCTRLTTISVCLRCHSAICSTMHTLVRTVRGRVWECIDIAHTLQKQAGRRALEGLVYARASCGRAHKRARSFVSPEIVESKWDKRTILLSWVYMYERRTRFCALAHPPLVKRNLRKLVSVSPTPPSPRPSRSPCSATWLVAGVAAVTAIAPPAPARLLTTRSLTRSRTHRRNLGPNSRGVR